MGKAMLILLVLLAGLPSVPAFSQPAAGQTPMAQAIAAIKLKPNWQRLEIEEEKPKSYRLTLRYKQGPIVGISHVSADTKEIARAVLTQLTNEGKDPGKDRIFVSVWGEQDAGKGETGKPLIRLFGKTVYDFNNDQLNWQPYRR